MITPTRSDMERRMRLLEMAGGNLEQAIALEIWVVEGNDIRESVAPSAATIAGPVATAGGAARLDESVPYTPTTSPTASASPPSPEHESGVVPGTDQRDFQAIAGEIPAHLRRYP